MASSNEFLAESWQFVRESVSIQLQALVHLVRERVDSNRRWLVQNEFFTESWRFMRASAAISIALGLMTGLLILHFIPSPLPWNHSISSETTDTPLNLSETSDSDSAPDFTAPGATVPASLSAMRCPTVFVYSDTPQYLGDLPAASVTRDTAFAELIDSNSSMFATRQWDLGPIFLYRLSHSTHCKLTLDPAKADLFFIPAMASGKTSKGPFGLPAKR
jgi:hypothetical protein